MKKAFVLILLAAIILSACSPKDSPEAASQLEDTPETTVVDVFDFPDQHQDESETEPVLLPSNDVHQDEVSDPEPSSTVYPSTTSVSVPDSSEEAKPKKPSKETAPVQPEPTTLGPEVTVPVEAEPAVTEPVATEPEVTQPPTQETTEETTEEPTEEPAPTEPVPAEPEVAQLDIAALESYGRSYASSAYGYNGTSACGPGSGAGYFPGATKQILTMADGYRFVRQAIDAQYARDIAGGYAPYEEIDGVTVRCPINVRVEPTGQDNTYVIWVYYGGV